MDSKKRWRNILMVALSDKKLSEEEKSYLEKLRRKLDIETEEANAIAAEVKKGNTGIYLKGNREEKLAILRDIIEISLADGSIDEKEQSIISKIGKHIGVDQAHIEALINECKNGGVENTQFLGRKAKTVNFEDEFASDKNKTEGTPPPPPARVSNPKNPNTIVHPKTGIEFIKIMPARFVFGNGAVGHINRGAVVGEHFISTFPVTNAAWSIFEKETGYKGKADMGPRFDQPELPVVGVSYNDAKEFCKWAGLRLPKEMEWEYAARGSDERHYPWGNKYPSQSFCNYGKNIFDERSPATTPQGTFTEGISAMGCEDMAGNVAEWCLPNFEDRAGRKPTRGGHWLSAVYAINCYYHDMQQPDTQNNRTGFRVVAEKL